MKLKHTAGADNAASHITPPGGNVFADLGFDAKQAKALQAQTRKVIAKKLAIKQQLMDALATWMESEQLTQAKAATLLGVSRPRVSDVIRHKNSNFTVDALIDMVMRTGQPLHISV
jgi:predicted XRE-type DNA-binding protein